MVKRGYFGMKKGYCQYQGLSFLKISNLFVLRWTKIYPSCKKGGLLTRTQVLVDRNNFVTG